MQLIRRKQSRSLGRPVKAMVAVAVAAAVGLAGCGTISKLTTKEAVATSFSRLQGQSSISVALSLGLTPQQITQLASQNGGSGVPTQVAELLSKASIVFSEATGHGEPLNSKQTKSDSANSYDFGLQVGSSMPVEIRYVDQALYARVQIDQLLSDVGEPASDASSVQADLQKADQYVPGLAALGQGEWVTISKASLQPLIDMLKAFEAQQPGGQASAANVKASVQKLEDSLKSTLKNNASYSNAGTAGGRTEYIITVALRSFVQQAASSVQSFLSSLPGGLGDRISSADIDKLEAKVPAQAKMQLYVKDDKAQEIVVDLNQFVPAQHKAPFAIPLQLIIGEPGPVPAPSGATPLDLSKIGQLITGMMSGLGSGSSSSSSSAS